jgi:hypothetical protein
MNISHFSTFIFMATNVGKSVDLIVAKQELEQLRKSKKNI